jgi:hypothetical protein
MVHTARDAKTMMSVVKSLDVKIFAKMLHVRHEVLLEIPSRMLSVNLSSIISPGERVVVVVENTPFNSQREKSHSKRSQEQFKKSV